MLPIPRSLAGTNVLSESPSSPSPSSFTAASLVSLVDVVHSSSSAHHSLSNDTTRHCSTSPSILPTSHLEPLFTLGAFSLTLLLFCRMGYPSTERTWGLQDWRAPLHHYRRLRRPRRTRERRSAESFQLCERLRWVQERRQLFRQCHVQRVSLVFKRPYSAMSSR
jgi:hypothetical protein